MRALLALSALALATPATAEKLAPPAGQSATCQPVSPYLARDGGDYRGKRLAPQLLNQFPPATTYMAVYRHIGGCEAPLTLSDYRAPKGR
jgi:hypothetical protein